MLNERRSGLLNIIVEEYVDTAVPVGSKNIVAKHGIPLSSATVRMEMARLEEEGYISQPHTSAGRVPSDKGYRYYVESLMSEQQLAREEREMIRHQFHQAERDLEEWFQLAAAVLAHSVRNFAVVTSPRNKETRLRHVQLVALQDASALLVVVLQEARVRQQVMTFPYAVDQESLSAAAARVNASMGGLTGTEIRALGLPDTALDAAVVTTTLELLDQEALALGDVFRDGVREVLSQPEFARSERLLDLVDVLEQRTLATAIPVRYVTDHGINVVIGAENSLESMRDCSIVLAQYGGAAGPTGVVAVLGPTRMQYARTIPTVRYLAALLGELVSQI
jgi:heat-inducible transcriptional repressor